MSLEKMGELVLRYGVPFGYICKVFNDDEYISTPCLLYISMCDESFQTRFYLPRHPFIETLLWIIHKFIPMYGKLLIIF